MWYRADLIFTSGTISRNFLWSIPVSSFTRSRASSLRRSPVNSKCWKTSGRKFRSLNFACSFWIEKPRARVRAYQPEQFNRADINLFRSQSETATLSFSVAQKCVRDRRFFTEISQQWELHFLYLFFLGGEEVNDFLKNFQCGFSRLKSENQLWINSAVKTMAFRESRARVRARFSARAFIPQDLRERRDISR